MHYDAVVTPSQALVIHFLSLLGSSAPFCISCFSSDSSPSASWASSSSASPSSSWASSSAASVSWSSSDSSASSSPSFMSFCKKEAGTSVPSSMPASSATASSSTSSSTSSLSSSDWLSRPSLFSSSLSKRILLSFVIAAASSCDRSADKPAYSSNDTVPSLFL